MPGNSKHTLFITGAAGYVGSILCDQFARRKDVEKIIGLDIEEIPELLKDNKKIVWVMGNTADKDWESKVTKYKPTVLIHTAWHIREMYGKRKEQWRWNVDGSRHIFDFALQKTPTIQKLIHFSSAAVYGAYKTNTLKRYFTEDDPMREKEYSYGQEKKRVEEILQQKNKDARTKKKIFVVRPAAVTGPRGRFMRIRFGLQSALAGQLRGNIFYRIVSVMVSFVPATPWWARQFVHEDDITDIVERLAFEDIPGNYEIFNLAPPGEPVMASQMADVVGKRVLRVWPWMVRVAFFAFWHLSHGKIPNGKGVWRFYSYPVLMDGSKVTRVCGYHYKYKSDEAFRYTDGRYESYVPDEDINTKHDS